MFLVTYCIYVRLQRLVKLAVTKARSQSLHTMQRKQLYAIEKTPYFFVLLCTNENRTRNELLKLKRKMLLLNVWRKVS